MHLEAGENFVEGAQFFSELFCGIDDVVRLCLGEGIAA